ncbi:hypothetical protein [Streptomyces lavendofoliae]|uniref:hypothetical protein n=1 Tax=Streptomyces lavendofoliae TaxID=67314 RepID=UPI003D917A74
MLIRESRSMATVVPSLSTLAIWVIDSSDVSVPVISRAAMAAARSGLGRRTVIVCAALGLETVRRARNSRKVSGSTRRSAPGEDPAR